MSTKIYNGLRITETNIFKLNELLIALRLEVMDKVREKKREYLAQDSVHLHDMRLLGLIQEEDKAAGRAPLFSASSHLRKADDYNYVQRGMDRSHEHAYPDYTFELCMFPVGDQILAIPYTEERDFENLLTSKPWIQEYGYWDNGDQPEFVTDEEWKQREKDWDLAFKNCYASVPANGSFEVNLSPRLYEFPTWSEIKTYLRTFDDRVNRLAEISIRAKWSKETYERLKAERNGQEPGFSEYVFGFGRALKEEPVWQERLDAEKGRIREILPAEITPEMLGFPEHRL